MIHQDYANRIDQYLSSVNHQELLEYAGAAAKFGEIDSPAFGILKLAINEGVRVLSPKQLILLYKEFIEKIDKSCAVCGSLIELHVFEGPDTDTTLCSYHNYTKDKE